MNKEKKEDLIVLYLGRGIGSGMILNGALFRDRENISGQFGEITVFSNGYSRKLGDVIREDIFPKSQCNPSVEDLKKQLECEKKRSLLVDVLAQSLSNLIHIIGIKDIIFSGKFDGVLDLIESDLNRKLETMGIYGMHLHHSIYNQYSASVGAAMGCFYNLYGVEYSWN
jgi:predicted NBD/HSP70 family sugar kinase